MADEPVSQAVAAAPAAVSSPLSSPAPSPLAPAASVTPAADGSAPKPASPATTEKTTEAVARPEGLPDSYWDAEKNALKVDAVALVKDLKERDELKTFKAAEDVRRNTLPKTANDYKSELSSEFKLPAGSQYKFDAADPNLAGLRELAHKQGWTQEGYSKALDLYASVKVAEDAQFAEGLKAQKDLLGPNAGNRVDAVLRWAEGMDPSPDKRLAKSVASTLLTAPQVEFFETVINRTTSQGAASFSTSHRVAPDDAKIPGYEGMSFEQRRLAQDQRAQQRRTA